MYLKQMGQVPLLTREQEVQISKRIEEAEHLVQQHINRFGFTARAHIDLAQKLAEGHERFDRVILDKKIESRERYMKLLPRLCQKVEKLAETTTQQYAQMREATPGRQRRGRKLSSVPSMACNGFTRGSILNKKSPKNSCIWPINTSPC